MENVLKYFEFSTFINDKSNTFSGSIAFSEVNQHHFLIFEKINNEFNLYVTRYEEKHQIGKEKPEVIELLINNYDKSLPEHRIILRKYLE